MNNFHHFFTLDTRYFHIPFTRLVLLYEEMKRHFLLVVPDLPG